MLIVTTAVLKLACVNSVCCTLCTNLGLSILRMDDLNIDNVKWHLKPVSCSVELPGWRIYGEEWTEAVIMQLTSVSILSFRKKMLLYKNILEFKISPGLVTHPKCELTFFGLLCFPNGQSFPKCTSTYVI